MTIELIKADELRLVAGGPGKQGRVGVLYQVQPTGEMYLWDGRKHAPVSGDGDGIADSASVTLAAADADTSRIPSGAITYTVDAATAWTVGRGVAVWLPTSGTISFAVSGGSTLNGGTTTLTRTLAANAIGYVLLQRVQGSGAYTLSGV